MSFDILMSQAFCFFVGCYFYISLILYFFISLDTDLFK